MLKLNFACGGSRWPGFENSDINGEEGVKHIDLAERPYPYENDSAELVMISHALQMTKNGRHIHGGDVEPIFREFHRILCPGGWLRIDDNPCRIYKVDEDVDPGEVANEAQRGFPPEMRIDRHNFIGMLKNIGFGVREIDPNLTAIPCDAQTRDAIVGNHMGHISFSLEATK
jgi:predicted SAM-dependent methyltransferase